MTQRTPIRVFVPHLVTKFNPLHGRFTPALNFSDAFRFGELRLVLDFDYKQENFDTAVEISKKVLAEATENDYFIPTGDPALISICAAEIAKNTGRLNLLRWDRLNRMYFVATTEIK